MNCIWWTPTLYHLSSHSVATFLSCVPHSLLFCNSESLQSNAQKMLQGEPLFHLNICSNNGPFFLSRLSFYLSIRIYIELGILIQKREVVVELEAVSQQLFKGPSLLTLCHTYLCTCLLGPLICTEATCLLYIIITHYHFRPKKRRGTIEK